jgi:hypothetical protein
MFVMKARVGQLGGAEALGALTGVLTATWMIAALSHLGIPDHAMVRAAVPEEDAERRARARHALFLSTTAVALGLSLGFGILGTSDPWLAGLLVVGAIAQHASSVTLQTLRGLARPGLESASLGLAAAVLLGGAWLASEPRHVGASYLAQGAVFVGALGVGLVALPSLRPAWPSARGALDEVRRSLPIFVVGATAFGLGSSDVILSRLALGDEAVGALSCATMVVRTGFQVPWVIGTLALARARDVGPARGRFVATLVSVAVLVAVGAAGAALATGELASRALGVPLAEFEDTLRVAALLAPVAYVAVVVLPLGMALALRETVWVTLAAAVVTAATGLGLAGPLGLVGVQVGYALGHLVLGVGLALALSRTRAPEARA